jgi:hypothetical protein
MTQTQQPGLAVMPLAAFGFHRVCFIFLFDTVARNNNGFKNSTAIEVKATLNKTISQTKGH